MVLRPNVLMPPTVRPSACLLLVSETTCVTTDTMIGVTIRSDCLLNTSYDQVVKIDVAGLSTRPVCLLEQQRNVQEDAACSSASRFLWCQRVRNLCMLAAVACTLQQSEDQLTSPRRDGDGTLVCARLRRTAGALPHARWQPDKLYLGSSSAGGLRAAG